MGSSLPMYRAMQWSHHTLASMKGIRYPQHYLVALVPVDDAVEHSSLAHSHTHVRLGVGGKMWLQI